MTGMTPNPYLFIIIFIGVALLFPLGPQRRNLWLFGHSERSRAQSRDPVE